MSKQVCSKNFNSMQKKLRWIKVAIATLGVMSFATILKLFLNLGVNKFVAINVGPEGFANFADIVNLVLIFSIFSGGFLNLYISKDISSENNQEIIENKIGKYFSVISFLVFIAVLIIYVILSIGANFVSFDFIPLIFVTALLGSITTNLAIAILTGLQKIPTLAVFSLIQPFLFLILLLKINGTIDLEEVIFCYALSFFCALIPFLYFTTVVSLRDFRPSNVIAVLKSSSSYSLMLLMGTIIVPMSQIYIRGIIGVNLSVEDAGIWQSLAKISETNLFVISAIIGPVYLVKIANSNDSEIRDIFALLMKILVLYSAFYVFFINLFSSQIILTLYSSEFLKAAEYVLIQSSGDFFRTLTWLCLYILMIRKITKYYIFIEIATILALFSLSFYGLKMFGLDGIFYSYLIVNVLVCIICLWTIKCRYSKGRV